MDLLEHYSDIVKTYPEYVTQQQMSQICGVCISTARKLEKDGVVSYTKASDGLLHTHRIPLIEVLACKYKLDNGYKYEKGYLDKQKKFWKNNLKQYPDLLLVSDVSEFTGYVKTSVQRWIDKRYLMAFLSMERYRIPKTEFITFLTSTYFNTIRVKSAKHKVDIEQFRSWNQGDRSVNVDEK